MTKIRNLAIAALVLTASPLWAIDTVTVKSTNKQVLGEISTANKTEVTIKPKTGDAVKIPANDIANIKWEGEPAKLNIAKGDEDRGNFDKALDTYGEVHKDASGKDVYPQLDLVRLAIPRRVYTTEHMRYVADSCIELYRDRDKLRGLRLTYEAPVLRHFTARLEEISDVPAASAR